MEVQKTPILSHPGREREMNDHPRPKLPLRAAVTGPSLVALLAPALLLPPPAAAQPAPLRGLDSYVTTAMEEWEVPGLALAVVKDDSVVYARGYGVRELGEEAPVDEHTLFAVASTTKAFTAAALGMLVDEELVGWDDPVTDHLPGFRLQEAYPTRELTVRDLVAQRSGASRCDRLWYATSHTRQELLRRVRRCGPRASFRARFSYHNILYTAAGRVAAEAAGERWDRLVEERIFAPLGMDRSNTSVDSLDGLENVATPHEEVDGELRPVPWRNMDNIGPAGSINSTAREMAQWVRLQLNEGTYEGTELLAAETVEETHRPQMVIGENLWHRLLERPRFLAYGMGWFLHDYRGRKVVEHPGGIDGMRAQVGLLPGEELGVVILTNRGGRALGEPLMFRVFDAYLDARQRDWASAYRALADSLERERKKEEAALRQARAEGTSPSLELGEYAGVYTDSLYGRVTVEREADGLLFHYDDAYAADLVHWHHDTFRARWRDPVLRGPGWPGGLARSLITFRLDARGSVTAVQVPGLGEFQRDPSERPTGSALERGGEPLMQFRRTHCP